MEPERPAIRGVGEAQLDAREQQARGAEEAREGAVERALAVRRVAEDRVGDVLEVAADLVLPAGVGIELDERDARGVVMLRAYRHLGATQAPVVGARLQARRVGVADVFAVLQPPQGMVDRAGGLRPAADDREVALLDRARLEGLAQPRRGA